MENPNELFGQPNKTKLAVCLAHTLQPSTPLPARCRALCPSPPAASPSAGCRQRRQLGLQLARLSPSAQLWLLSLTPTLR